MKRTDEDVVGRPRLRDLRRDVAGVATLPGVPEVASFRHALDDPMGTARSDAVLLADFDDFMTGGEQLDRGVLLPPDPVFRERLRRRLWRTHVMTHLRDGGDSH